MATNVDKYFVYAHLPENLKAVSKPIAELAKLLEAKDCFVITVLFVIVCT